MQSDYSYELVADVGKDFDPHFNPDLSPREMLEMGVFGGKYMTDCTLEFPQDWFTRAKLSAGYRDPELNYFGVLASKSLAHWRSKGWIYAEDPRGWFQWYCRYYSGRRSADDDRQIKRWKAMRRHVAQVRKNCERFDLNCRCRQRQALLQWAYDARAI
jgi:hypothetical protein